MSNFFKSNACLVPAGMFFVLHFSTLVNTIEQLGFTESLNGDPPLMAADVLHWKQY